MWSVITDDQNDDVNFRLFCEKVSTKRKIEVKGSGDIPGETPPSLVNSDFSLVFTAVYSQCGRPPDKLIGHT